MTSFSVLACVPAVRDSSSPRRPSVSFVTPRASLSSRKPPYTSSSPLSITSMLMTWLLTFPLPCALPGNIILPCFPSWRVSISLFVLSLLRFSSSLPPRFLLMPYPFFAVSCHPIRSDLCPDAKEAAAVFAAASLYFLLCLTCFFLFACSLFELPFLHLLLCSFLPILI